MSVLLSDLKNTQSFFVERRDGIKSYLRSITHYPILSAKEQAELAVKAQQGDKEARTKLMNSNQRFVYAVAKRYSIKDKLLDLVNEGNIGMLKAIDSFDPSRECGFLSYAVWLIRREITQYIINYSTLVKRTNQQRNNFYIQKANDKFFSENFRGPSTDELVEIFKKEYGIKIKQPSDLYDVDIASIDANINNGEEDQTFSKSAIFNSRTASYNQYEDDIEVEYNKELIKEAMRCLTEKQQKIIKMLYGIGQDREYTLCEVAKKIGYTQERIRQIRNLCLVKMSRMFAKQKA